MRSLNRLFIHGLLFLGVVTITLARKPVCRRSMLLSHKNSGHRIPKGITIEQLTEPLEHSEGPHWDALSQKLYFVDAHEQKVCRLDPATGDLTCIYLDNGVVGMVVTVQDSPGQLVAVAGTDVVLITWDGENNSTDPTTEILATVDSDRTEVRFNDGKVDSHGRLWAGTMGIEDEFKDVEDDVASLYLIKSDLEPETVISPVSISNGIAWNRKDNVFYYIDSVPQQVAAYDFDSINGKISNKRIVFDMSSENTVAVPDGMTIDNHDNLWIALHEGGHVINWDPVKRKLLRSIEIPGVNNPTSVIFGGPLLDILYVTTSRHALTAAELEFQPQAGSVFAIKGLGVRGLPANSFALHGMRND